MSAPFTLGKIIFNNFKAYYGEQEAEFPSGSDRNVMAIHGANTNGKTSFINGIQWCLYGKIPGGSHGASDMVSLFNGNAMAAGEPQMSVSIEADLSGQHCVIRRVARRKYPNTPSTRASDFAEEFTVTLNGDVLSEDQSHQVINRIAPEVISRFFLFDGELLQEYEGLIAERSKGTNYHLTQAIDDVLGLPALKTAASMMGKARSIAQDKIRQETDQSQASKNLSTQAGDVQDRISIAEDELKKIEDALGDVESEREDTQRQVKGERKVEAARIRIDDNNDLLKRRKASLLEHQEALKVLADRSWVDFLHEALQEQYDAAQETMDAIRRQDTAAVIDTAKLQTLKSLAQQGQCGTCKQPVSGDVLRDIQAQIADLEAEVNSTNDVKESMDRQTEINVELRRLMKKLAPVGSDYANEVKRIDEITLEITETEDSIDKLEAEVRNENLAEVKKRRERLDFLTRESGRLGGAIIEAKRNIKKLNDELEVLNKQLNTLDLSSQQKSLSAIRDKVARLHDLFDAGLDALRDHMRLRVQDYVTTAYRAMIHEPDHKQVSISKDGYQLSILDKYDRPIIRPSAGATQVLALALIVALGKAGRPIGPIVMDTPFGRLDEEHRAKVLKYLPRQASQLVLLYHSGELQHTTLMSIRGALGATYNIEKKSEGHSVIKRGEL